MFSSGMLDMHLIPFTNIKKALELSVTAELETFLLTNVENKKHPHSLKKQNDRKASKKKSCCSSFSVFLEKGMENVCSSVL